ncbi:MAG: hypothetical protein AB7T63_04335 [Planctomycetota bacterium]
MASTVAPRAAPELLVVHMSTIPSQEPGPASVLLEMQLVRPPAVGTWAPLASATPVAGATGQVWWSDEGLPARASGAEIVSAPSILALPDQDASMTVGEAEGGGAWSGIEIRVTPTFVANEVRLVLTYRKLEGGRVVSSVPETTLQGPSGRTFFVQAGTTL